MTLQEKYERSTGNKAKFHGEGLAVYTAEYVHWLERFVDLLTINLKEMQEETK